MNARILNNLHAKQKQNEKKAFDQMKKKAQLERDELQAQAQQMPQVRWPLLVHLTSKMLLGIIGIPTWGVGFIPRSAWVHFKKMKTLLKQFKQA